MFSKILGKVIHSEKKQKLLWPLQCMEHLIPYESLKQLFLYSWKFYVDHVQYLIYCYVFTA